jgi:hypothetical protein
MALQGTTTLVWQAMSKSPSRYKRTSRIQEMIPHPQEQIKTICNFVAL